MKIIITESQYNLLTENKNKKFLIKTMGYDFTGKIKEIKDSYDVPMSFDEGVGSNLINRWLNHWGPMYLVNVKGKDYLYQNRGDFEMFIDEKGYDYVDDEIPEQLGISDMGLKFSDIIDIFFNEGEPLNESIDKNKKKRLFIKMLGEDLINSIRTIYSAKELPKEFLKSLGSWSIQQYIDAYGPLYYFVFDGEPFIYKHRVGGPKGEYEMFTNSKGESFFNDQINNRLGLSDVGLRFLDVINTFHNDEEPLNESVDKNKKFLINLLGQDLIDSIQKITSTKQLPKEFLKHFGASKIVQQHYIDLGPLYYFVFDGEPFIYRQRPTDTSEEFEIFTNSKGKSFYNNEIPEKLGIDVIGLNFSDIINIFYNQEEPLNESVDNKKIKVMERFIEDIFSDYDWYEGLDTKVESFTFRKPEYSVPLYVFYLMSNDRLQANIDLIEYENGNDDIDEMFSSLFPKDKTDGRRYTALYVIRVA